jgi:hypothetical protein
MCLKRPLICPTVEARAPIGFAPDPEKRRRSPDASGLSQAAEEGDGVHRAAAVGNRDFFPNVITGPFHDGLHKAFAFAICACLLAALMSWSRGRRRVERESTIPARRLGDGSEPDII